MNEPTSATPNKLVMVDDDLSILSQLKLALEDDFEVHTATDSRSAWSLIQKERPDLVTLDLSIEDSDPDSGFGLLDKCVAMDPLLKVIMLTGNDTQENAARAVKAGAYDFFGKPVDLEALRVLLGRAASVRRLEQVNRAQQPAGQSDDRVGGLLGVSQEMQGVFRLMRKVAPTDYTVLILGESGTGKEVVAREIHRMSRRKDRPFVSISCASIPESLLESELFGHEKGAFTSAHATRPGRLEVADGGTVFLDEIGDMPTLLQVKLLRFLQEREIERVGGRRIIPLDVRVLAATNRDLTADVRDGRFREDLLYRLTVVDIQLPPLRKRNEDILFLAKYFLDRFASQLNRSGMDFSRSAKQAMAAHRWSGNVRELEHRVQRAALMAHGRLVQPSDLELSSGESEQMLSLREARDRAVQKTVVEALRRTHGNISKAALELDVSRPTLHDLLRKLDIDAGEFRNPSISMETGAQD